MSLAVLPKPYKYPDNIEVHFIPGDGKSLSVLIETERLYLKSVESTEEDYNNYASLYGNQTVMEKFADGQIKTKAEIQKRIDHIWAKRWRESDPYSSFAVFKKDSKEFVGHVVLGHTATPGVAEMAIMENQSYWRQGYGTEAVRAIVTAYAPATIKEGYLLDGKPLHKIIATARLDNPGSFRIMEKLGMQLEKTEEKFGAIRHHYSIELRGDQKKTSEKVAASASKCLIL